MRELVEAIFECNLQKVKILLLDKRRINQAIHETDGCTPLHIAVGIENADERGKIVSYLLELGADPNARTLEDLTPVHIAAMWNNCTELEKLLKSGGNPWLLDNDNKNSFDLAIDNHAYEAYQLLHKYLSEDKLNFWSMKKSLGPHDTTYHGKSVRDNSNYFFKTANENFPYFFSSNDDITSVCSSDSFLLEEGTLQGSDMERNSEISFNKAKIFNSNDSSLDFTIDSNKVTKRKPRVRYPPLETVNVDDFSYLDSDDGSCFGLFEGMPSKDFPIPSNCDSTCSNSWKFFQTVNSGVSSTLNDCSSHDSYIEVPKHFKNFSNSQIYMELKKFGDNPGPIIDSTRTVYLQRLVKLKTGGCAPSCPLPSPKYCDEIYLFLEGKLEDKLIRELIDEMTEDFKNTGPEKKWRDGNKKCSFNYFLLDPRVTQDLPRRSPYLSFSKLFLTFVDSLFYVGKGTKNRPYCHLIEALRASSNLDLANEKILHILDIWDSGMGVVSLHCFNNSIPAEAYSQESCIIEAIGLENLTNIKSGNCYGVSAKWRKSQKRKMGIALLFKALQIYLLEGEKQIFPKDISKNGCEFTSNYYVEM